MYKQRYNEYTDDLQDTVNLYTNTEQSSLFMPSTEVTKGEIGQRLCRCQYTPNHAYIKKKTLKSFMYLFKGWSCMNLS